VFVDVGVLSEDRMSLSFFPAQSFSCPNRAGVVLSQI
jgi:hypothetical protein